MERKAYYYRNRPIGNPVRRGNMKKVLNNPALPPIFEFLNRVSHARAIGHDGIIYGIIATFAIIF